MEQQYLYILRAISLNINGNAKAVMLSQDNYTWTALGALVSVIGISNLEELEAWGVLRFVYVEMNCLGQLFTT